MTMVSSSLGYDLTQEEVSTGAYECVTPLFSFRVYPMEDDKGQVYYYAQTDNIPECSIVAYSPEEVFPLMAEAQKVWLDIFLEDDGADGPNV